MKFVFMKDKQRFEHILRHYNELCFELKNYEEEADPKRKETAQGNAAGVLPATVLRAVPTVWTTATVRSKRRTSNFAPGTGV